MKNLKNLKGVEWKMENYHQDQRTYQNQRKSYEQKTSIHKPK